MLGREVLEGVVDTGPEGLGPPSARAEALGERPIPPGHREERLRLLPFEVREEEAEAEGMALQSHHQLPEGAFLPLLSSAGMRCQQMRGVGIVFSRFLDVDIELGVLIGMGIVFFYAVLGGMKGITYTQVVQYCLLIFAYLVPAIFISILLTFSPSRSI